MNCLIKTIVFQRDGPGGRLFFCSEISAGAFDLKRLIPALFAVVLALSLSASAQKNELALTVGGYFPAHATLDVNAAPVIEGSFAHRIYSVPMAALYVELPVAKTFDADIASTHSNYSALFVAPGLKLKLAPSFPVSPWVAVGGGVAHFSANAALAGVTSGKTSNSGVVDFGSGVDMKVAPFISVRGQVRDYYSSSLKSAFSLQLPTASDRQHNIVVSGGLVLRF
jgi:hypothetical protein